MNIQSLIPQGFMIQGLVLGVIAVFLIWKYNENRNYRGA